MADLDENPLPPPPPPPGNPLRTDNTTGSEVLDADLSGDEDEQTQDYRFLTSATSSSKKEGTGHLLPRRGAKDFEPHGTQAQSSTLGASQAAMHEALSFERVFGPAPAMDGSASDPPAKSSHVVGFFQPDTSLTYIPRIQGTLLRSVGRPVKGGRGGTMLEPEEALWMCERGSMELRFGEADGGAEISHETSSLAGLTMSVQAAYACCLGSRGLTLERYTVYASLKRAGYTVFRAKGAWGDEDDEDEFQGDLGQDSRNAEDHTISLQTWLQSLLQSLSFTSRKPSLPLIGTGFFRDYATIYNRLSIIPTHNTTTTTNPTTTSKSTVRRPKNLPTPHQHPIPTSHRHPPLQTTYNAWKPSTSIKLSAIPAVPEIHVVVLDARETSFPTPTQLSDLLAGIPDATAPSSAPKPNPNPNPNMNIYPNSNRNMYTKLKTGGKSVVLAVVDSGLVSYIRVCEGVFARERVWERNLLVAAAAAAPNGSAAARGGAAAAGRGRGGRRGGGGRGRG